MGVIIRKFLFHIPMLSEILFLKNLTLSENNLLLPK
jgi:hypothetical protein